MTGDRDSVVVFAGPTIDAAALHEGLARSGAAVQVEAPAARGDLLRAAEDGAHAIALIDGLYESVPSTWHKEILWAIEHGVRVYGASSMGAIRAAECAAFGMIGVGAVYEGFAADLLDDDDVALAHASADDGYRPISEAMVNVRATLTAAGAAGVIDDDTRTLVDSVAKALFYPDRQWARLDHEALAHGADADTMAALRAWRLDHGTVDQKRADAEMLMERLVADIGGRTAIEPVRHRTAITAHFERMRSEERSLVPDGHGLWRQPVLEELQVQPDVFADVIGEAVRRRYARTLAVQSGARPEPASVDAASDRLRRRLDLLEPDDLWRWLDEHGLDLTDYTAIVQRETLAHLGASMLPVVDPDDVMDVVRMRGLVDEVRRRSETKAAILRDAGVEESGHLAGGASADDALDWFCRTRLGRSEVPSGEALDHVADQLGFADSDALRAAVLREFHAIELGLE